MTSMNRPESATDGRVSLGCAIFRHLWISLIIVACCLFVYSPVIRSGFIDLDDDIYVTDNPTVQEGLTANGAYWAFSSSERANTWHPLTWLSHMLDCQLYGLNPGRHHLTNLLIHIVSSLLLFGVLYRMTGATIRSGLVAMLFAIHPLHVEPVAWISERKEILCGLFLMLTLAAYVKSIERRAERQERRGPLVWYGVALLCFVFGLMSKATIVTLPFVLLLLDYWPLGRFAPRGQKEKDGRTTVRSLVLEKIPFFVLSFAGACAVILTENAGGTVVSLEVLPLTLRIVNAPVQYVNYIGQTLWPTGLSIYYVHPQDSIGSWAVLFSVGTLIVATAGAWLWRRRHPYILVGWLWFLGVMFPVIGLIQQGTFARADRYTYIPLVGLFVALVWGGEALMARLARGTPARARLVRSLSGIAILSALAASVLVAKHQVEYWRDSETLFKHALALDSQNHLACCLLGQGLAREGRFSEALPYFERQVAIIPAFAPGHQNLGSALLALGRYEEAIPPLQKAVRLKSSYVQAHNNLAIAYGAMGRLKDAQQEFETVLKHDPHCAPAKAGLEIVQAQLAVQRDVPRAE